MLPATRHYCLLACYSLCATLALFQHVMDSALRRLDATPIVIGNSYSLSKHGRMPSIEKPIDHVSYRYRGKVIFWYIYITIVLLSSPTKSQKHFCCKLYGQPYWILGWRSKQCGDFSNWIQLKLASASTSVFTFWLFLHLFQHFIITVRSVLHKWSKSWSGLITKKTLKLFYGGWHVGFNMFLFIYLFI